MIKRRILAATTSDLLMSARVSPPSRRARTQSIARVAVDEMEEARLVFLVSPCERRSETDPPLRIFRFLWCVMCRNRGQWRVFVGRPRRSQLLIVLVSTGPGVSGCRSSAAK